ncbi:hypothetical protein FRB94_004109 [Tulasnella sp. JGI-2019a]|nr:hypothetical protein FRB94_004109 [Tulasnella sp. JGI-2019a]
MYVGVSKTTIPTSISRRSEDDAYGGIDDEPMTVAHYSAMPSRTNHGESSRARPVPDGLEHYAKPPLSPLRPPNRPFRSVESTHSSSMSMSSQSDTLTLPHNRGTWRSDISGASTYADAFAFRDYESASAPQVIITEPSTPRREPSVAWAMDEAPILEEREEVDAVWIPEDTMKLQLEQAGTPDVATDGQMTPSNSAGRTKSLFKASNFSRPLRAPARADSSSSDAHSSYERSESALSTYSTSSSLPSISDSKVHMPSSTSSPYNDQSLEAQQQQSVPFSTPDDRGPTSASSSSPSFTHRTTAPTVARRPTNPIRFQPPRMPPAAPPPPAPAPASWSSPAVPDLPSNTRWEAAPYQQPYRQHPPQPQHLPQNPYPDPRPHSTQRQQLPPQTAPSPERPIAARTESHPAQWSSDNSQVQEPEFVRGNTSPLQVIRREPSFSTRSQIMEQAKGRAPPPPPLPTITTSNPPSGNQDQYARRPSQTAPPPQEVARLGPASLSPMTPQDRYSFYDPEMLPRSPGGSSKGSRRNSPSPSASPLAPPTESFLNAVPSSSLRPEPQHVTKPPAAPTPHHHPRSRADDESLTTDPKTAEDYLQLGITYHQKDKLVDSARCFEISAKGPGALLRGASIMSHSTRSSGRPSGGSSLSSDGDGGCAVGMLMWGLTLRSGWGVKADQEKGFKWLRRAAEFAVEDLEMTRTKLGGGDGGNGKLSSLQIELVLAIYEVGQCFFHGWGVKKDQKMAVSYFLVAARMGDVDAQQELAFCYLNGSGTKKDKKEAAKWYRKAATQGASTVGLAWIYKDKYM